MRGNVIKIDKDSIIYEAQKEISLIYFGDISVVTFLLFLFLLRLIVHNSVEGKISNQEMSVEDFFF